MGTYGIKTKQILAFKKSGVVKISELIGVSYETTKDIKKVIVIANGVSGVSITTVSDTIIKP